MKAIVITAPGGPEVLQMQERPTPSPGPEEIVITVKAAGINRPDVLQRAGKYPTPAGVTADIPGLEVAGEVLACGKAVRRWQPGDAVCALVGGGGYAQQVAVHHGSCLPLPQGWSFAEAAALPETVFTVWHNVFQRGALKAGERLLVHGGSSGIGTTAIQLARAFGAQVFTTAGTDEKCRACEALGASQAINYRKEDFAEVLEPGGMDVILDMVGGDYIAKNLDLLRPDGRLVFINAMQGAQGQFNALDLMRRRLTVTGSTLRPRDLAFKAALAADIEKNVWPKLEQGTFKPIIHQVFDLAEAASAHALMETSQHIGKIILRISD